MVEKMAYRRRDDSDIPWHRHNCHPLPFDADWKTALTMSGADWTVEKRQAFYLSDSGMYLPIPDQFTLTRSDTGAVLGDGIGRGATVGSKFRPLQNSDMYQLASTIRDVSGNAAGFETAGVLEDGRKVWVLLQLAGDDAIRTRTGEDRQQLYLLIFNAHDGSNCVTTRACRTRVVCRNTSRVALSEKMPEFKNRHTGDVAGRVKDAATVLSQLATAVNGDREELQALADTPMSVEEMRSFACQILSGEDDAERAREKVAKSEGRSRAQYERKGDELLKLFTFGLGNSGVSRYDAFNAVTEYVDHARGKATPIGEWNAAQLDAQANSVLFGHGELLKNRARELLRVAA